MPVQTELKIIVGKSGESGLRIGDVLTAKAVDGPGTLVATRELKTYMEVTLRLGKDDSIKTRRLPMDAEWSVVREVLTQGEKDAAALARLREEVERKIENTEQILKAYFDTVLERWAERRAEGYVRPFDLERAGHVAKAQEKWALWNAVGLMVEENDDVLKSVALVRDRCRETAVGRYRDSLSRSTSVLGNLEEDLARDAASEFVADVKYMGVDELLERLAEKEEV